MTDRRTDVLEVFEPVRLQMNERTSHLLFRLQTSSGRTGWGEASMSGDDEETAGWAKKLFAGCLAHQPLADLAILIDRMKAVGGHYPTTTLATSISGLDQALWDLRGQQLGVPIHELLGGMRRRRIQLYANINRGLRHDRSPEAFAKQATDAVRSGFGMVKCAPFDDVVPESAHPASPAVQLGVERVAAIRDAVGADVPLMVDCHGRLDRRTADEVLPVFENLELRWLEEPLATHHDMHHLAGVRPTRHPGSASRTQDQVVLEADALAQLSDSTTLPFAGGEFFYGVAQFEQILSTRTLSYVMPDIKHCGGIWEAVRISTVASARGVAVSPHNPCGPISTIASAHLCAALPELDSLEYQWGEIPQRADLIQPRELVVDGHIVVPDTPGLGAAPNREAIAEYVVDIDA